MAEKLRQKHFEVTVDYVYPLTGTPRNLSYGYALKVKGDSVISYLPYFGRAYSIPYGGGKGLDFTGKIKKYVVTHVKTDRWRVEFETDSGEDVLRYSVEVFDNGKAAIDVNSNNRESIRYSGEWLSEPQ